MNVNVDVCGFKFYVLQKFERALESFSSSNIHEMLVTPCLFRHAQGFQEVLHHVE